MRSFLILPLIFFTACASSAAPSSSAPARGRTSPEACDSNANRLQLQLMEPKARIDWLRRQGCAPDFKETRDSTEFCYLAHSQEEFGRLAPVAKKKGKVTVAGKSYPCVEDATPAEPACYFAKSKKEFAKLSRLQDAHPDRPLKISGKLYRCIQN